MNDKEYFEKQIKKIQSKLENNSNLKEELDNHIKRIEEIFETNIEVNILIYKDIEEYKSVFNSYEIEDNYEPNEKTMSLKDLIDCLKKEENNLKVAIDPIYLNEGVNEINDLLLVGLDKEIIIVPKIKKNE